MAYREIQLLLSLKKSVLTTTFWNKLMFLII